MNCLTEEQLAAIAIGIADDGIDSHHAATCEHCHAKNGELRRLNGHLSAAHAEITRNLASSRPQLLARLEEFDVARTNGWMRRLRSRLDNLTVRRQIAAGIGLTTLVGMGLLFVLMASVATPTSAMERMARQLRAVQSYSYQLFSRDTFTKDGDTQPTTVIHTGTTIWQAPHSFRYDEKLTRTEGTPFAGEKPGGLLGDFTGIHPSGEQGLMVFHDGREPGTPRTFYRMPPVQSDEVGDLSPITRLKSVREGSGTILRSLGSKEIDSKRAQGYVMALDNAEAGSGFDALEVWIDAATDLPLEIGYEVKSDEGVREFRISDCRWNIDIAPGTFDTTPPADYAEVEPPK